MSGGGDDNDPEDSPQTRHLAYVAAEKWNFAQRKLRPLQDLYMEQVGKINSDQNKQFVRGRANDGAQDALGAATGAISKRAAGAGLDLDSGRVSSSATDAAIAAAKGGGETSVRGEFELGNQEVTGMQNILNMGNGQETRALSGMKRMSQVASNDARQEAISEFNRRSANLQTLGTVGGAAVRYGMGSEWGNAGQQMVSSEDNPLGWSYDDYGGLDPTRQVGLA